MKNKSNFICFVGIDGSGKTTLAKSLVNTMEARGITSEYVYNRLQLFISKPVYIVGKALFFRGKDVFQDYKGYSHKKRSLFKHRVISSLYSYLLLFDYFFQVMLKIKLPLMRGKNLVCDRYIYDTIVTDLAIDMDYSAKKVSRMIGRYLVLCPKPDITFLVDVPEEIAYQRKNDVPSIDYLKERRAVYLHIGQLFSMTILDGSKNVKELETEINQVVFS